MALLCLVSHFLCLSAVRKIKTETRKLFNTVWSVFNFVSELHLMSVCLVYLLIFFITRTYLSRESTQQCVSNVYGSPVLVWSDGSVKQIPKFRSKHCCGKQKRSGRDLLCYDTVQSLSFWKALWSQSSAYNWMVSTNLKPHIIISRWLQYKLTKQTSEMKFNVGLIHFPQVSRTYINIRSNNVFFLY
jgi:hypothetical protein